MDFECGKMPVLDPQVRACLSISPGKENETLFLTAPVRWIEAGEDGEMTALGVGSMDGKVRQEPVATLHSLATRIASHSSMFQSQRTEKVVPSSRPTTSHSLAVPPGQLLTLQQRSRPTSKGQDAPTTQPVPNANPSVASAHDQSAPGSAPLQHPLQNGAPPEKISMPPPPPPADLERMKTEFVTPATEPSEIKSFT